MTLYLLKVHLQTFLCLPITQKWQILSCDTLVANKRNGKVTVYYDVRHCTCTCKDYRVVLVAQHCNFMLNNFMYFRILIF